MRNILKDMKIVKCHNGAGAGTSAQTSTAVDMAGFNSVCFVADLGTVTDNCVLTLKCQDGAASNGSDAADITGATTAAFTAATSSNTTIVLDVQRPQLRYVTAVLSRTTQNAVLNTIVAILYNADTRPTTQPTSVIASAEVIAAG